jgi:hypothetical protein
MRKHEIREIDDFIYGYALGCISNAFSNLIVVSEGRVPTLQEKEEAKAIVYKRTLEIRNAISLTRYHTR